MALDPLRAHYLKRSLVALELRAELAAVRAPAAIAHLGPPFRPPPDPAPPLDLPLLAFLFRNYLLSFPFLAAAPPDFFPGKLQPFVDSLLARHLFVPPDADADAPPPTPPRLERTLAIFLTSAIKLVEPEEVLTLSQADLRTLERRRTVQNSPFRVNIVSVRTVTDRGRVRSRVHEEFIICTTLAHETHVYVSRRYGDFRTLANELRKAHPDSLVPSPPAKDRTAVHAPFPASARLASRPSSDTLHSSIDATQADGAHPPHRLSRERNRLTLRAYLHTLLATSPFSSSPVLRSFLLSGPTSLSPQEQLDAQRREEADRVREQSRKEFAREIGARVDRLRDAVRVFKGEIVGRDGLSRVFAIIKRTPHVRQLPDNYQAVLEWARISLASTIFQTFVASDNSSETSAGLKRVHGLMPYLLLKAALKISNPVAMIRSVLDIFLAQPFGSRSLLQRMFTSSLAEEARTLNTYIEHVSAKIDCPVLCEKIRIFVYAPREIQERCRADARLQHTHLLKAILAGTEEPVLTKPLAARVDRAWSKWAAWMAERKQEGRGTRNESDSEEGPNDEEAWLFEDLRVLIGLYSKLRDREQLIALIFEGVTAELLKDIITIFYTPLARVYRAANIAESLGDLQNFINDLIRTVERTEELSQSDSSSTVQAFIDLVNRHEQSFYSFVHKVHSKDQGLFDSLMKWIERFLVAIREGIGASAPGRQDNKIVLETVLPAGGEERAKIMDEVDQLMRWHYLNKIAREERLRSRFRRAQKGAEKDADAEEEATQNMINDVAREFDFSDLVGANADELAEESGEDDDSVCDEDEEDEDEDSDGDEDTSEYETDSDGAEANMMPTHKAPQGLSVHPLPTQPPLSRPATVQAANQLRPPQTSPKPPRSQPSLPPQSIVPRLRSLSLRSTKSMLKLSSRRQPATDAPPVPPLPTYLNKPLPPHPPEPPSVSLPRTHSAENLVSFPEQGFDSSRASPPLPPRRRPRKPKKKAATVQPPELKYIPTLLPVFVEMIRPLLRPQS